jgi:hypothetical protein
MPYYILATPANERSPPIPDRTLTIVCRCCGDTMKHFRTIEKLGVRPSRLIFVCPSCKGVDTREVKLVADGYLNWQPVK